MNNYKLIVYTMQSGDVIDYVAEYPALKGVVGIGVNEVEAILNLKINAEVNVQALKEAGLPIPESDSNQRNDYSGKLSLRISSGLHRRLSELSEVEGVSINQCIVESVSMYVAGKTLENKLCEKLDKFNYLRVINDFKINYSVVELSGYRGDGSYKVNEGYYSKNYKEELYA